jgi:hypothetical protein
MTLYCQIFDQLPEPQMVQLGPGSTYSHFLERDAQSGEEVERYAYSWRDFQIDLYVTRRPANLAHLEGFVQLAANAAMARGKALDSTFVQRIRSTRLVIGYVAGPNYQEKSRFKRLESLLLTLAFYTHSLLLWEGIIYDECGNSVIN